MKFYVNREHLLKAMAYPARYQPENLIKTSGVVFGIILVFLLLFTPFGVYAPEHKMHYFFICCLHALSPAIIMYVYFGALNYYRARRSPAKSWTLLLEYRHVGVYLLLTGVTSFLLRDVIYDNANNWSLRYLWEEIRNCFLAGCLFYFFLRLAGFYFQSKKGTAFVIQFMPLKVEAEKTLPEVAFFIKTQVKQDDFSLSAEDLLFARAEGNYVELTMRTHNQVNTEMKRISLTQFEAQISAYPHFFRCHRAYLVNLLHIEKVSGNSQGYLLAFGGTELKVPVSRAQLDNFKGRYEQLQQAVIA